MKKTLTPFLLLAIALPMIAWGATRFIPSDVKYIFLDERGGDEYRIIVENKKGGLYRMGEVNYSGSRYQLYEDIADEINRHRFYTSFDDDDIGDLLWGLVPFTPEEIADIRSNFSEGKDGDFLTLYIRFTTGDSTSHKVKIDKTFTSSADVSAFIAQTINDMDKLKEGKIDVAMVQDLHEEAYTGLSYFAPQLNSVVFEYDDEELMFTVKISFANEETREFDLPYKTSKKELVALATEYINDTFVEYDDADFFTNEIQSYTSWKNTPWMIDDIEEIHFATSTDDLISVQFTVKSRLSSTLIGTTILSTDKEVDINNLDALASVATELLEENQLFVHQFDEQAVRKILAKTMGIEIPDKEDDSSVSTNDSTDESEVSGGEEEILTQKDEDEQEKMYALLLMIILQYIIDNNLDIDISNF
ncbi:MAG: hypothetical protein ACKKL4_00870 [Patescibacteria group bacterium]